MVSLCPRGHAVPGQHELHEAKSWELRLVAQEDVFSLIPGIGRRRNTFHFSQSCSKSSDLTSAKGRQSQM